MIDGGDWSGTANIARGERESTAEPEVSMGGAKWDDSTRPAILFDPTTGKMAWPLFKPHFGGARAVLGEPQWCAMVGTDSPGCKR